MKHRQARGIARSIVIAGVIAVAMILAVAAFWFSRPLITVTRVAEGPVVESFYATGSVQPVIEYPIKTGNAGIITQVLADKGQHVSKGEELAVVEDPQLRVKLEKAKAELRQSQMRADEKASPVLQEYDAKIQATSAMFDNASRDQQRFIEMAAKGGASATDLDKSADHVKEMWSQQQSFKAQRAAARIGLDTELRIAEAALVGAQRDFDLQTLRSPIDGVVLDRPTPIGTRLNVNVNDHVMQIADVRAENLVMRAAVDEENVAELRDGQRVEMALYSFPGRAFTGHVTKIYDKADADRRTFEVDVKFAPPIPRLFAGMTGELAFVIESKERALVAPAQALQAGSVYTVRDGRLTRVDSARIGAKSIERIELLDGFKAGDLIVIGSVQGINAAAAVRTNFIDPVVAAGLNKPKTDAIFKGFN